MNIFNKRKHNYEVKNSNKVMKIIDKSKEKVTITKEENYIIFSQLNESIKANEEDYVLK